DADAVAEQPAVGDAPRVLGGERLVRRDGDALPAAQVWAGQQVGPALRVALQGTLFGRLRRDQAGAGRAQQGGQEAVGHGATPRGRGGGGQPRTLYPPDRPHGRGCPRRHGATARSCSVAALVSRTTVHALFRRRPQSTGDPVTTRARSNPY